MLVCLFLTRGKGFLPLKSLLLRVYLYSFTLIDGGRHVEVEVSPLSRDVGSGEVLQS